jgi:chromosome segregation ATPase
VKEELSSVRGELLLAQEESRNLSIKAQNSQKQNAKLRTELKTLSAEFQASKEKRSKLLEELHSLTEKHTQLGIERQENEEKYHKYQERVEKEEERVLICSLVLTAVLASQDESKFREVVRRIRNNQREVREYYTNYLHLEELPTETWGPH